MTNDEDEVFDDEGDLTDIEEFPFRAAFHDVETDSVMEMKVTEEALNDTLEKVDDPEDVNRNILFKKISTHETVETTEYFE